MLKIENLHKIYGKYHALSGLDMTVKEGALYGFVGPNGAGKTTAIKIMTGLLQAEEGSVLINGKDALADPDQLKSCIGYVLLSVGRTGGKETLHCPFGAGGSGR